MSIQKATGNMYPWVDYVHSYLRGACPYACPYCYVQAIAKRFNNWAMQGPLRFDDEQLKVDYGVDKYRGKTIFVEHTHDLFHPDVETSTILSVLHNCWHAPFTTFVFQTRNTMRAALRWKEFPFPCMVGTTIETTHVDSLGEFPSNRAIGLRRIRELAGEGMKTFVTIEPILEFDLFEMIGLIALAKPDFVNIGADSKGTGLQEPSKEKVFALIEGIKRLGIEIRTKRNLERLIGKEV
jgi:DNA repair photolyase